MRTKDELFRAAQREIAARRQHAVMQAETARRAAYAANPALSAADDAKMRAGLSLARTAALGGDMDAARAALEAADKAAAEGRPGRRFQRESLCPLVPLPAVPGHRHAGRCALQLCGRRGPPPGAGGNQRRQPAGAVPVQHL